MLKTTKSTTLNGNSVTEDGTYIASMSCTIDEAGNVSTSSSIANRELYEKNKAMVRKDMDDFTALCRSKEDEEATE